MSRSLSNFLLVPLPSVSVIFRHVIKQNQTETFHILLHLHSVDGSRQCPGYSLTQNSTYTFVGHSHLEFKIRPDYLMNNTKVVYAKCHHINDSHPRDTRPCCNDSGGRQQQRKCIALSTNQH